MNVHETRFDGNKNGKNRDDIDGINERLEEAIKGGAFAGGKAKAEQEAIENWRGGDVDSGRVFAARHQGQLLYVSGGKNWLRWDGVRWADLTEEDIVRSGKQVAETVFDHAFSLLKANPDDAKNKSLFGEARHLYKKIYAIKGMIESAQSEPNMNISGPDSFNSDPWLLGVPNGVVDLKTGTLLEARPEQYIRHQAGFPYNPEAKFPLWEKTLLEIFEGDRELIDLVQRLAGYSLTGTVNEEIFVYLDGPGGNGKSVFGKVISGVQGSYSCEIPTAAMTERDVHGSKFDRMAVSVIAKRAAWANETSERDVFDDSAIKIMSSKDRIPARYLYKEDFTFQPTHKLWIRGNHKPGVRDHTESFWRRIVMIPFKKKFSGAPGERLDLHEVILKTEGPGVLAWAVRGCLAWQKDGRMVLPKSILDLRKSYRDDTDMLQQWIDTACEISPTGWMWLKEAHNSYTQFLKDDNFKSPPHSRTLARALEEGKGFASGVTDGRKKFRGISLKAAW